MWVGSIEYISTLYNENILSSKFKILKFDTMYGQNALCISTFQRNKYICKHNNTIRRNTRQHVVREKRQNTKQLL